MIRQFAFHSGVKSEPPDCEMFRLYRKVSEKLKLSRKEKDQIANGLYGCFGSQSGTYRIFGWEAPFYTVLDRFLVRLRYDNCWLAYYAPDKTSLRRTLVGVIEIVSAPVRKK